MPEIVFTSTKDAVRWAEEVALSSQVGNTLGQLLKKPGAGNLTKQEVIDIAMTVSSITSACLPWKGMAMKCVYAGRNRSRDHELGTVIAAKLMTVEAGRKKRHTQLIALGVSTIKAVRSEELYGKRYPIKRMARGVGISREQFSKAESWRILRREAKLYLQDLLEKADAEIWLELDVRGWV